MRLVFLLNVFSKSQIECKGTTKYPNMQDLDVKKIKNVCIICVFTAKDCCLHDSANVISRWDGLPCRCPRRHIYAQKKSAPKSTFYTYFRYIGYFMDGW